MIRKITIFFTNFKSIAFQKLVRSQIPVSAGVYLITVKKGDHEENFYVGRTTNLQNRIYKNHLTGNLRSSQFQKNLVNDGVCRDSQDAKVFIKNYCFVRWIEESDYFTRGAIEGYFIGLLCPKHGISPEH